jgi:hypothetical protein
MLPVTPSPSLLLTNIQNHHTHHRPSPSPPPTHHRRPPFSPISHFFHTNPETQHHQINPFFSNFFVDFGHKSTLGLCPLLLVLVLCLFCRGLELFERGFQTLYFWVAHQVLDKKRQPPSIMPRGQGSSSRSSGTRGMVARRPIESRKLLLENTFAIKEEFSNNEATSWAIQELKNRGLKRLFKPIASTAYERLVREFYKHLSCECDQPNVLFSSINRR